MLVEDGALRALELLVENVPCVREEVNGTESISLADISSRYTMMTILIPLMTFWPDVLNSYSCPYGWSAPVTQNLLHV